ncbi:MAG TPA: bifunctional methylenetetrahydrofolate dehydrogenase/methenyltetrahydrofolate cyclohydrolase FolD [Bdellovibrionales bacterium]|mgnify:FL=1|nr:bifunctional methylenetetrahydrofolate dehydrogenase/methenyltetrahydrofolate cyclohydrolase FolD [Pseudobdellovibrionaceae bacterium]HAG90527.1 bifunctional methylenetetrahydrofolate dehydrogenase/methenyltetrahydrofolate cyclohydrolase FolD [Bdellovibrionales bacterium]|tara:strand:- start:1998 stop:2882 length:885 start_codon:yes stop_codon:yes gene_type:complete
MSDNALTSIKDVTVKVLDGKLVSKHLRNQIRAQVAEFKEQGKRSPGLAVIIVGDDPASQVYVRHKIKACKEVGIESFEYQAPATLTKEDLKKKIEEFNQNEAIDGILVQLPLPEHLSSDEVLTWVDPMKDADCLTAENLGLLWAGRPRTKPCTPSGVMEILKYYEIPIQGARAAVVGRSEIVGKPMGLMLLQGDATVTMCHSKTLNMRQILLESDVVVVAAGRPLLLGREDFKKDSVVIDVGIHRDQGKLCGDVRFDELEGQVAAATPVPGGVGPMTITMLLSNTLDLYRLHSN